MMRSLQAAPSVSLSAQQLRCTATLRWHAQVSHCLFVHAHGDAHAGISIPAITPTSMSRQRNIFKLCIALHTLSKAM